MSHRDTRLYALFGLALSIAIIIGMWRMKRWSVYLLAAYFVSKAPTSSSCSIPPNRRRRSQRPSWEQASGFGRSTESGACLGDHRIDASDSF